MGDASATARVVTWNIRFGEEIDAAIDLLTSDPELVVADALLLQELDAQGAEQIADAVGMSVHYEAACRHPQTGRDFGNAVLSRAPLRDELCVRLPNVAVVQGTPRIAVGATTRLGSSDVSLWCTHAETPAMWRDQRREQFRAIARSVGEDPADHVILGGDFNTLTRRGIDLLTTLVGDAGLSRVVPVPQPAVTLRRGGKSFTLDHVFQRGLVPRRAGVVEPGEASDHSAVWFEFAGPDRDDEGEIKT